MLADDPGDGLDWHGRDHGHHHRLEQQGEAAVGSRPWRGDLLDAALLAAHARHTGVQIGLVLEEVEVSPGHPLGVVRRAVRPRRSSGRRSGCRERSRFRYPVGAPRRRSGRLSRSMAAAGRAPAASASYRSCLPVRILSMGPVLIQPGAVLATVKDACAPRKRGGLRPSLTAAARDALGSSGRDEETALSSRTKKHFRWGEPPPPARVRWPQPTPNGDEAEKPTAAFGVQYLISSSRCYEMGITFRFFGFEEV